MFVLLLTVRFQEPLSSYTNHSLVGDQLLIKYWATIAGYFVMWIPILMGSNPDKSTSELTRDYARVSRYLQNVSSAVGELVLVINTLATISGRTRRVSELLETVEVM